MNKTTFTKRMGDWSLNTRPQSFSELYFAQYQQLPTHSRPGAVQTFAFTVHNVEHRTTTYHYKLAARSTEGAEQALGGGGFTLHHDQYQTADPAIKVPPLGQRVMVKITLEYEGLAEGHDTPTLQAQSIHYWVTLSGQPTAGKDHHDAA